MSFKRLSEGALMEDPGSSARTGTAFCDSIRRRQPCVEVRGIVRGILNLSMFDYRGWVARRHLNYDLGHIFGLT